MPAWAPRLPLTGSSPSLPGGRRCCGRMGAGSTADPSQLPAALPGLLNRWFQSAPALHGLMQLPPPKEGHGHDRRNTGLTPRAPGAFVFKMALNLARPGQPSQSWVWRRKAQE